MSVRFGSASHNNNTRGRFSCAIKEPSPCLDELTPDQAKYLLSWDIDVDA
ncbi:MAG: hypothetical protein FWD38_03745 [Oscillospiraceae bacterium]|nr:hypothetical protein [Oscillospiraceae bacterium]